MEKSNEIANARHGLMAEQIAAGSHSLGEIKPQFGVWPLARD